MRHREYRNSGYNKEYEADVAQWISISDILVANNQVSKVDRKKIEKHIRSIEDGSEIMPIDVVLLDGGKYRILGNGRHRYFAAMEVGMTHIPVVIHDSRNEWGDKEKAA